MAGKLGPINPVILIKCVSIPYIASALDKESVTWWIPSKLTCPEEK